MKFIEITVGDRTYFINPLQITHAEYIQQQTPAIVVRLTETGTNGQAASLTFQGNAATSVATSLQMLEMET